MVLYFQYCVVLIDFVRRGQLLLERAQVHGSFLCEFVSYNSLCDGHKGDVTQQ